MATSFSTQGATSPFVTPTALNNFTASVGATPQARALTNMSVGGMQTSTPQAPQVTMPQAPSQPVVSHTVSDAAGNTVTQKYATPEPGLLASSNSAPTTNTPSTTNPTSNPNANYNAGVTQTNTGAGTPANVQSNSQVTSTPSTNSSNPQTQQGLLSAIQSLITNQDSQQAGLTSQEQALTNNFTNMNAGILSQPGEIGYQTGRQAQLQNTEQQGLSQLEGQQAQLAAYEQPQLSALTTEAGLLGPQQQAISAPAGGVTTLANTGQQFSNPIYEPATGAYQALSPQPNGTPGQAPTAGQASQYAIKSGDTLNAIAAANGIPEATLAAANPGINANDLQIGSNITIPASGTDNTAFSGGVASGQAAAGQQQVANQTALAQARSVQGKISSLLAANPTLNASPASAANAVQAWAQSTAAPTGPYVNLLNDLQEYANTIAPVLGVGGAPTDNKIAIATQLVPLLASGQTIEQAIQNLDDIAVGKINAVPQAAQNAAQPAQTQGSNTPSSIGQWGWTPQ